MTVPSYVPNDTYLVGGKTAISNDASEALDDGSEVEEAAPCPSMLLLTGPNYSGKSVYMKQVTQGYTHLKS